MTTFEKCLALAEKLHEGQLSRGGEPYIEHCKRVAEWFDIDTHKSIAILHDVLEEGRIQYKDLSQNVGTAIASGVESLTKYHGESYNDYIARIPARLAKIKLADITDNLCSEPSERQKEKYRNAIRILLSKI